MRNTLIVQYTLDPSLRIPCMYLPEVAYMLLLNGRAAKKPMVFNPSEDLSDEKSGSKI